MVAAAAAAEAAFTPTLLTSVRSQHNSADDRLRNPSHLPQRLPISNPSWIVRTESNVWKGERKKPNPPCVVCGGNGSVACHHCCGKGRTNYVNLEMLPRGKWPKWCRSCGGSGLGQCCRCLGTGEYRDIMGFHFMKMEDHHSQHYSRFQYEGEADKLLEVTHTGDDL